MRKSKISLVIIILLLVINIQIFPLLPIFSICSNRTILHNNCIEEEPITKPELRITEVIYNYKKHIFAESDKTKFNAIYIDNLNVNVVQENYLDKFNIPIPYLVIKGEIKYDINSGEMLKLYIKQYKDKPQDSKEDEQEYYHEFEIGGKSEYWHLFWKKDENNSFNFTFYNNGLNNNLEPLIPIKSEDKNPKEIVIKIKCKDQAENESEESTINLYYSPKIWLKLTVGNTKVEEIKPDKQVKIKGEPKPEDWKTYQVYDESTKNLKDYKLSVAPINGKKVVLIPVRFIAEEVFGAKSEYNKQIKEIKISTDKDLYIYLYVGSKEYYIWDKNINKHVKELFNEAPQIKDGRTFAPTELILIVNEFKINNISDSHIITTKADEIQIIYSTLNQGSE